jgi:4-carboxymuconolactone decarboxylase
MLPPDPPPRMPPVDPDNLSDEARDFLGRWSGGIFSGAQQNPVLLTFAHHPTLAGLFSQFNIHLLSTSTLPVKQRQIAIMRVAWLTKATYMWSSHLNTSISAGLEPDFYEPVKVGADDPYFTDFERAVIRATEELLDDHKISDANWQVLMTQWDNRQMLDFMFTVGAYVTVAGVMRSTGAQRQPDLLALAERYGAPEA